MTRIRRYILKREWLMKLRESKNFTQEFIAEKSHIERSYYSMIEKGIRTPSVRVAKRIAKVLSIDWTFFYTEKRN